ncbi:uncharacterized protein [Musca autumnalis]|uniref:uncharacterized protein n=1 Tax=Musca autumnalis TaxID=221902 RepID=UPI003CEB3983
MSPFAFIWLGIFTICARATLYEFVPDNDKVFDSCSEIPDNNGIHDIMDMSEINIELLENSIAVNGNCTVVWKGVQPTDRIQLNAEVYKFQRGDWQQTTITFIIADFCPVQFEENSVWYRVWSSHIPQDERKCINNYGHVYHQHAFEIDSTMEFSLQMEGRHKIVVKVQAFDELNNPRENLICVNIFGEFYKI